MALSSPRSHRERVKISSGKDGKLVWPEEHDFKLGKRRFDSALQQRAAAGNQNALAAPAAALLQDFQCKLSPLRAQRHTQCRG